MDEAIVAILNELRSGGEPDAHWLDILLRRLSASQPDPSRRLAKRQLLPYYLAQRTEKSKAWESWHVTEAEDDTIVALLRAKPRRTASGVATITVLMKPWPCASDCLYCPNDIRMPKSYLSDEPACQRAEHNRFDPYLQVASRLRVLSDMGHNTDKIELIVLGGTFSDYPLEYRTWFIGELFRALNEVGTNVGDASCLKREAECTASGTGGESSKLEAAAFGPQREVNSGTISYRVGISRLGAYPEASYQRMGADEVAKLQQANEDAAHRVVGLVVETRPDCITPEHLIELRRLGCTKVQVGLQSLTPSILKANARGASLEGIERAFELLREFGFKSHVHFMANLLGATPESDLADFVTLVTDERFLPDEVKLYPCALVESSRLTGFHDTGEWKPYEEAELIDLLAQCIIATPAHTRISRMIRDISSSDIIAGNKKTNLRQMVEQAVVTSGERPKEMRMREIATSDVVPSELHIEEICYATSNTQEVFLQWVNDNGALAGFCRLSLPNGKPHAMIREVHIYGRVSKLHEAKEGAQHSGLGRALVKRACEIASQEDRESVKVISAVGTRGYYRNLGFEDGELYQEMLLT